MATLNELVNETTNIKNEIVTCHESLKSNLVKKGIECSNTDKMSSLIEKVDQIKKAEGNAVAADVLSGKTFTNANGGLITGTMANRSATTAASSVGGSGTTKYFRIPQGAYVTNASSGYPEITATATQIDANIKAANIIKGVSICGVAGSATQLKSNGCITGASMPSGAGVYDAASGIVGSNIYVIGGSTSTTGAESHRKNCYCYSITGNSWSEKTAMPTARRACGACVVSNKIYVIGGFAHGHSNDRNYLTPVNECYDPATNTWTTKAPMISNSGTGVGYHNVLAINNEIYVVGGKRNSTASGDIQQVNSYNPKTDTWTSKANMPKVSSQNASVANGNLGFIITGRIKDTLSAEVYCYDSKANTWSTKASIKTARLGATAAVYNNKIYVFGGKAAVNGANGNAIPSTNLLEVYDISSNAWSAKPGILGAHSFGVSEQYDGNIYVFTGFNYYGIGGNTCIYKC